MPQMVILNFGKSNMIRSEYIDKEIFEGERNKLLLEFISRYGDKCYMIQPEIILNEVYYQISKISGRDFIINDILHDCLDDAQQNIINRTKVSYSRRNPAYLVFAIVYVIISLDYSTNRNAKKFTKVLEEKIISSKLFPVHTRDLTNLSSSLGKDDIHKKNNHSRNTLGYSEQIDKLNNVIADLTKERDYWKKLYETLLGKVQKTEFRAKDKYIPIQLSGPETHAVMEYLEKIGIVVAHTEEDYDSYGNVVGSHVIYYEWLAAKVLYGYFVDKMSYYLELATSGGRLQWKIFDSMFINASDLRKQAADMVSAYKNNSHVKAPENSEKIDEAIKYAETKPWIKKESDSLYLPF